jgi:urea transporter
VGIPTMLAASALKIFKAFHHPAPGAAPEHWDMVGLGFVVSAIVSFIAVKWLLRYVQTHTFVLFGWYRIGLAAVVAAMLLLGTPTEPQKEATPQPTAQQGDSPAGHLADTAAPSAPF